MTKSEAVKKGFLQEKTIVLKPSPRGVHMGIKDPNHKAYFQIDQGSTFFCLPRNRRGDLVDVFVSDEEREFFEKELGTDLNSSKEGNFFETFDVKVTKDSKLMKFGESFDLMDPMDNIRYRVLKESPVVAPNWEKRKTRKEYRWALVDGSKIEDEAEVEFDTQKEFWMMLGRHNDTPKLRSLLRIYFNSIRSEKKITLDMTKKMLMNEINFIFNDPVSRKKLLSVTQDPLFELKEMVIQAAECKAIVKNGADEYSFAGETQSHTFNEIAEELNKAKLNDIDIYFIVKDQIEKAKE